MVRGVFTNPVLRNFGSIFERPYQFNRTKFSLGTTMWAHIFIIISFIKLKKIQSSQNNSIGFCLGFVASHQIRQVNNE